MKNSAFYLLVVLVELLKVCELESYQPLHLKLPTDYEVPTESFTLCDLNQDYLRSYCFNKGICYTLVNKNKPKYDKDSKIENSIVSDIFCSCTSEYTGTRCEIKIEINTTKANVYQLIETTNRTNMPVYKINVKEYGKTLPKPRECPANFECFNGATCVYDILNGPKCNCVPGFVGDHCDQRDDNCPELKNCFTNCDFGYKRDKNNCELCECNCVNEENYFEAIKNAFLSSQQNKSQFCKRPCKLGYYKDEYNCFKCECLEDYLPKPDLMLTTIATPISSMSDEFCSTVKCGENEVCKYFDKSFYNCPEDLMNCKQFEKASKIPICVANIYPDACMDTIKIGSCSQYSERYYFDIIEQRCKKFYYSGCSGNQNNFESLEECRSTCIVAIGESTETTQDPYIDSQFYPIEKVKILGINDSSNGNYSLVHNLKLFFNSTRIAPTISQTTTNYNSLLFKTISIPNVSLVPFDYNLNKSNDSNVHIEATNSCRWVCDLNCPFGYKLDQRTKCYKCECIDLNMTECGVPCFLEGTKSCLYSMRANSRPKCVCHSDYEGVYCHSYNQHFNFSVRIEKSFKLNLILSNEIKTNLSKKLSSELEVNAAQIIVNELKNNLKDNSLIIRFSLHAPDFSNANQFFRIVGNLHNLINRRNLTLNIQNKDFVLLPNCERNEETILMDLNEAILFKTNNLKSLIKNLKNEMNRLYKIQPETIVLVKMKIEPILQLEFVVKNNVNDPEFCKKSYHLQNDIRSKIFTVEKLSGQYADLIELPVQIIDEHKPEAVNFETSFTGNEPNDNENIILTRSSSFNKFRNFNSASLSNSRIAFVSVIVTSFLLLLFLICIAIIMQLKIKQAKKLRAEMNESMDKKTTPETNEKISNEFAGYFMPNYNTLSRNQSDDMPLNSQSIKKINVVSY